MRSLRFLVVVVAMGAVCSVGSAALFFEDFESFDAGEFLHDLAGGWKGWDDSAAYGSPVSDAHAYSGSKSVEIIGAADLVHEYNVAGGKWVFTAMQYIPSGATGTSYFILLNTYHSAGRDWSVQTTFNLASGAIGFWHGGAATIIYDEWVQLKYVIDLDENTVDKYYNGEFYVTDTWDDNTHGTIEAIDLYGNNASSVFYDDIKIQSYLSTLTGAANPSPAAQAVDVERDSVLEWTPGVYAAAHDVYFGTSADDVAAADRANPLDVLVSQGQTDTSLDPEGLLEFGQTYYWRVDEVNAAPDSTIFKGEVLSFTAEPFSYPITGITATASSAHSGDMQPEKTIDGSGLNDSDQHLTEATAMWLSGTGDQNPWIQYEFDKVYKLDELWVWNSNQVIESFLGLGAKDVTISYSTDGDAWTVLEDNTEFAQATGADDYAHNTTVALGGVMAKHVKIAINAGFGLLPQYGLSEVRFFFIPTYAREPQPTSEGSSADADVVLDWRPGREAASHEVYLGTDPEALALAGTTTDSSFGTGPLDYNTTYYWSVTEINEAEATPAYAGDVWSFATPPYGIVDDFELYDDDCKRIFFAWADGLGHNGSEGIPGCNVAPSNGNGTGSIVGNDIAPFAEQAIVNSGGQSLPLSYDGMSEATLALDGQDWTASGIQTLSLAFFGAAGNTGQLYIKINNTKVAYDGDPSDIATPGWRLWMIDLSTVGGNLQNVTSLTIGIEGGGIGMLYIDDIRLYAQAIELVTPTAPDAASLLVHYTFNGDALDSSGNDHHGEENGGPVYGAGVDGQALQFDGIDDYVNVALDVPENGCTMAFWFNTTNPDCGLHAVVDSPLGGGGHDRHIFLVDGNIRIRLWDTEIITTTGLDAADGQWHHVAYMYGDAIGGQKLYVDGLLLASGTKAQSDFDWQKHVNFGFSNDAASNYLEGMLDDARIYDRTLTPVEIAWLSGKTEPMGKPF